MNVFNILRKKLEEKGNTIEPLYNMPVKVVGMDDVIDILNQVEQEYNNGWIPCSERLPDNELEEAIKERGKFAVYPVLVTVNRIHKGEKCRIVIKAFYSSNNGKHFLDMSCENLDVIAWQPLPQPYKASENE